MTAGKKSGRKTSGIVVVSAILIVVIIIVAVYSFLSTSANQTLWLGNTSGNVVNDAMVFEYSEKTYVAYDKVYTVSENGTLAEAMAQRMSNMVVSDGILYYANLEDGQRLYMMDLKSGQSTKISENSATDIQVAGEYVYYVSDKSTKMRGVYAARKDGSEVHEVTIDEAANLLYYKDRLYFINKADQKRIYSMDTNGQNRVVVALETASFMDYYGGLLYYSTSDGIYQAKPDGSGTEKICDMPANYFNIVDGKIYFSYLDVLETGKDQGFYRVDVDGRNLEKLTDMTAIGINRAGKYLYFRSVYDDFDLYRLNMETGEITYLIGIREVPLEEEAAED